MGALRASLRAIVPAPLRRRFVDWLEWIPRTFPGEARGIPGLGLSPTQVYPSGSNFAKVIERALIPKLEGLGLEAATPVASIGTCFAEEFAFFMAQRGFNYVRTEADAFAASANWGRVYTIPNFLQIVRYSVQEDFALAVEQSEKGFFDPLREYSVAYAQDRAAAEAAIRTHRRASHAAFRNCRVLVLTVGQNEAWVDRRTGFAWGRIPAKSILDARKEDFQVREFSYAENLDSLREALSLLRQVNPDIKLLITVSPVASHASFSDSDVVSRSFANKCLLRTVVEECVRAEPQDVFYFPSFEMVLCYNPESFRADNRHVKHATVSRIFDVLERSTGLTKGSTRPGA